MPGIVGIISRQPADVCQRQVAAMVRSLEHEPFYRSGVQAEPKLGIYAGWVAHAGSLAADQVFWNERKDIALLFAGECFSDPVIRAELKKRGHDVGRAAGDWLVHQYEEQGESFFVSLNGLFSGLLIDQRQGRAFLFNDRYGIERLYWFATNDATYFASEAKALLRVLPELRAFDENGVAQFLTFGCTLEWRTLFRGVQLAPGGTLWTIEGGTCRKGRYFTPAQWESLPPLTEAQFDEQFAEVFPRILPRYVTEDARVGVSLTGGLDTRMIMACLPKQDPKPLSYTFAGVNGQGEMLDARIAAQVAAAGGLSHELLRIEPDFFAGFGTLSDRTVYLTDGCFGALGAHEIYLNAQARRRAAIRVTGNFGSEVLRSMSTFKPLGLAPELCHPDFTSQFGPAAMQTSARSHPVTFAAFEEIPWNLFGCLAAGRTQVIFRTPYLDNEVVSLAFRAPQSARTSPQSAVRFVQSASPELGAIATDRGVGGNSSEFFRRLRRAYAEVTFKLDYMCSEGLPFGLSALDRPYQWCNARLGIMGMHKFLQYRSWLQRELAAFIEDRLASVQALRQPFWNPHFIAGLASAHISGRKNFVREINAVLTLGAVERLMFRDAAHAG